jgi:hypothetical protein
MLGCAWMFLYDVFSFSAENTESINVARRMTHAIRITILGQPSLAREFDVFIAMCWSFVSKILIRDVKRLQAKGDTAGECCFISASPEHCKALLRADTRCRFDRGRR